MSAHLDRRALLGRLGVGAVTLQSAGLLWPLSACAKIPSSSLAVQLCDLTIPSTDTPGAVAAGVPAFILLAMQHRLEGTTSQTLASFEVALNREAVRQGAINGFGAAAAERQAAILADVDARVFARGPAVEPADLGLWAKLKTLIVAGYYTSEIGASQELRYELVPGEYQPDLALKPGDRAWSSDWTAEKFG